MSTSWIRIRADVKSLLKQLIVKYEEAGVNKEDATKRIYQANELDPSGPNKANYTKWLVSQDIKGNLKYPEDKEKYLEVLKTFDKVKQSKKVEKKDINQYPTFIELYKTMESFMEGKEATSNAEEKRMNEQKGQKVLFQEGIFKVIEVTTPEAATVLFRGYKNLCIKDPKFSKEYLSKGPIYAILKNNEVYAVAENEGDIENPEDVKDIHDVFINEEMFKELKPILNKLGIFLDYMSDQYSVEDGEYFKKDPKSAYYFAKSVLKKRWPEAEEMILKDSYWGKQYKKDVIEKEMELSKVSSWIKKIPVSNPCCCRRNNN